MKTVNGKEFFAARQFLDPEGLAGLPEAYERQWLAEHSPYPGKIHRLLYTESISVLARLVILQPADGSGPLFCFYGRSTTMSFSERRGFFLALKAWLHAEKITTLQGPLEFSTWHPYRFVCERADSPWFAGEQPMPDYHYKDFLSGGFSQGPQYESTWVGNLAQSLVIGKKLGVERGLANLQIETVRGHEIVDWLPRLHKLSTQTFQGNYGYSEIDCTEFCELYASVVAMNAAVVLASDTEGPIGMAFSYAIGQYNPDPNQPGRSCSVLKSLGTHPRARKRGIGFAVSYLTHRLWLEQGCEAIIHAYMMSNNVSRSMSAHFGSCLRRYALVKWTTE